MSHKIVVFVTGMKEINVIHASKTCNALKLNIPKNDLKTVDELWGWYATEQFESSSLRIF